MIENKSKKNFAKAQEREKKKSPLSKVEVKLTGFKSLKFEKFLLSLINGALNW